MNWTFKIPFIDSYITKHAIQRVNSQGSALRVVIKHLFFVIKNRVVFITHMHEKVTKIMTFNHNF